MNSSPDHPIQGDQAAALGCLDVLCGASALLNRHKLEIAGLLPEYGSRGRGALERLMADLGEVLGRASAGTSDEEQQLELSLEEARGGPAGPASPRQGSRAKRAKRQQQQQQQQQQQEAAGQAGVLLREPKQQRQHHQQHQPVPGQPWPSTNRDPLSIEEVLERVMSFAEGRELLGRLSRVCRLWRRVSEAEALCVPVVRRYMRSALLGGAQSLHARLGGSARRCLTVYNGWARPGRVMCGAANVDDLRFLVDISYDGHFLASQWWTGTHPDGDLNTTLQLTAGTGVDEARWSPFSAASLGEADVHAIFTSGRVKVRLCVMDPATGVTACLFQGPFRHEGAPPDAWLDDDDEDDKCIQVDYCQEPIPVTSRTYGGPSLQARLELRIRPTEWRDDDWDSLESIHLDRQRCWGMSVYSSITYYGQPGIYAEQFIRSRLAEEEAAQAAGNHGIRCCKVIKCLERGTCLCSAVGK